MVNLNVMSVARNMRLPRKVTISGKVYKVSRNPKRNSGWGRGNLRERVIEVGSKNKGFEFTTYVHEITEVAMLDSGFRFERDGNPGDFFYRISHSELDRLTNDIATALEPMLR